MSADDMPTSLTIADAMAEVARSMNAHRSVDELLESIARTACDTVPGITDASVTVPRKGGGYETNAATGTLPRRGDKIQYELGEGPCVEALDRREFMSLQQPPDTERWPRYAPRAAELGIRSQMAFPLFTDSGTLGGLNLYSTAADRLDEDSHHIGELFATQAALALGKVRGEDTLNTGLSTRKTIGQAIGIVQERYGMDETRAFQFLSRVSQTGNIKLREVAKELVNRANQRGADSR